VTIADAVETRLSKYDVVDTRETTDDKIVAYQLGEAAEVAT
jgi:hypothetical protein